MVPIEVCHTKSRRMSVSIQLIFNVIVGVALIMMCSSGFIKFHQFENKLQGYQAAGHAVNKRQAPISESCNIQCPRGPPGPEGTKAIPGVPGVPGVPGNNGEPGCKSESGATGETGEIGPQGIQGLPGKVGKPGPLSERCERGTQGPNGPNGPNGNSTNDDIAIMASCDALKKAGFRFNGIYLIDPDGPTTGLEPYSVVCDMTSDLTKGYTTIHHDKKEDGKVKHHDGPGSFRVDITYDLESAQIEAIKRISTSCRQFIKYACIGSVLRDGYGYWMSVDGVQMVNWGGVPTGIKGCACWMTKSCDEVTRLCNCDVNDSNVPRVDQGYLTDKATLPVSQLRFGDTGAAGERGVYTLGPFQCA